MGSEDYFDQVAGQWDVMQQRFFSEKVRDKAISTKPAPKLKVR